MEEAGRQQRFDVKLQGARRVHYAIMPHGSDNIAGKIMRDQTKWIAWQPGSTCRCDTLLEAVAGWSAEYEKRHSAKPVFNYEWGKP